MRFPFRPLAIRRSGDDAPMRNVFLYVWRMSGRHQVSLCLLALVVAGLGVAPLELQRRVVDDSLAGDDRRLLWQLCGLYLGVVLLLGGAKYLLRVYQGWLAESAIRYSRGHLAGLYRRRTEDDSPARGETDGGRGDGSGESEGEAGSEGGRAVSIIGAEVEKLGGFVGDGLSQPVANAAMLAAIMAYMLTVEPLVALASLLFLLPLLVALPLIQRRLNRLVEQRLGLLREVGQEIASLGGPGGGNPGGDPRGAPGGEGSGERLDPLLDRVFAVGIRRQLLKFLAKGLINFTNNLAPVSILLVGGLMVLEGSTTLGTVLAFVSGFQRMSDPARELLDYYRLASRAEVQHRMIARWM